MRDEKKETNKIKHEIKTQTLDKIMKPIKLNQNQNHKLGKECHEH